MFNYEQLLRIFYPVRSLTFWRIVLPCAIISSYAFINFWRISSPVRFHALRLFDKSRVHQKSSPFIEVEELNF